MGYVFDYATHLVLQRDAVQLLDVQLVAAAARGHCVREAVAGQDAVSDPA